MMQYLVLATLVTAALLGTVSAAHKAPFLLKIFKELSGEFGACADHCVARDSRVLQEYVTGTCMAEVTAVQEDYMTYAFKPTFYQDVFQRQGSLPSRMCMWYRRVSKVCAVDLVQKHLQCTPLVVDTLKDLLSNLDEYLCSADLPFLECMMSPDLAVQGESLGNCTHDMAGQLQPYFGGSVFGNTSNFIQAMRTFYNMEVVEKNGDFLYKGVPDLARCVTSILGAVTLGSGTTCGPVQDRLDEEVDALITYIKDDTDLLMCALNPDLLREVLKCGMSFAVDLSTGVELNVETMSEDTLQQKIVEELMSADFYALKSPFKKLRFCVEEGVKDHCGEGWVYNKLKVQLDALQLLVDTNGKTLPPFCIGSTGSIVQQTFTLVTMMTSLLMFPVLLR